MSYLPTRGARFARAFTTFCLAGGMMACPVIPVAPPTGNVGAEVIDAPDADVLAEVAVAPQDCDPTAAVTGCPEAQYCDNLSAVCVDCVGPQVRCDEEGGFERCDKPEHGPDGVLVAGGFFVDEPCASDEVCVPILFINGEATSAECRDAVCEPNTSDCCSPGQDDCPEGDMWRCLESGSVLEVEDCDLGGSVPKMCYEGACDWVRNNVLVIFDTSSSMWGYVSESGSVATCEVEGTPCMSPWPQCDDQSDPLTLLTLAKRVFNENLAEALADKTATFALQRFPQSEQTDRQHPSCFLGYYTDLMLLTGDDGAWETFDGGWFDTYGHEVIATPFPAWASGSNADEIVMWFDGVEQIESNGKSCEHGPDSVCPGQCRSVGGGEHECFAHTNPELRAAGDTPLGKSLFYAGEYFRRHVLIDGQPCIDGFDCRSSGYICDDGVCVDPFRHCKENIVLLFTDGMESPPKARSDYFHPVNQSRLLAGARTCGDWTDCPEGVPCELSADCWPTCADGECPGGTACTDDDDCVSLLGCDLNLGICASGEPCSDDGDCFGACRSLKTCPDGSHCLVDDDCGGAVCGSGGTCPDGSACTSDGACIDSCGADLVCDDGTVCTTTLDCYPDARCVDGLCLQGGDCTAHEDCLPACDFLKFCDVATPQCQAIEGADFGGICIGPDRYQYTDLAQGQARVHRTPDGSPIVLRTNVITLHGAGGGMAATNGAIAAAGRGEYYDVTSEELDSLAFRASLMRLLSPDLKCQAE